jgi:hypothetical protein
MLPSMSSMSSEVAPACPVGPDSREAAATPIPVPVIDMSLPEDIAAAELRAACTDVGFFYREHVELGQGEAHVIIYSCLSSRRCQPA